MKKCKSCQSEIDDKAKKCPHCQTDQRNWFIQHKVATVILGIFILGGVIPSLTVGNKVSSNTSSTTSTNYTHDLQGNIRIDSNQLVITNSESADWTSCKIKLNGKYNYPSKTTDWAPSARIDKIKASDTAYVNLNEFTLNDGSRFNIYSTKAQDVSIDCDNGFGYWKW
ncbi:MAG: hypothetical protein KIH89_004440 [Candidatus Shapirobacteria bacterium]|nr:hypothetical protein [Candidatus Shapirobacteria bacterium]